MLRLSFQAKARGDISEAPPTGLYAHYYVCVLPQLNRTPKLQLSADNEWLKPGASGSTTKRRTYTARPGCVFIQTIELAAT
jgi:hypothetical protein